MTVRASFKYGKTTHMMELGYALADSTLSDMGVDVLSIISDGGETLQRLMLDDRLLLKVYYHYVQEATGDTWETALETLDETEGGLEAFREAFLKLIVSFTGVQGRKMLEAMIDHAKTRLKNSKEIRSMLSSSSSSEEQVSTLDDTHSES